MLSSPCKQSRHGLRRRSQRRLLPRHSLGDYAEAQAPCCAAWCLLP